MAELQALLADPQPGQRLIAMPGAGTHVPIWLLGSSLFSAQLAAERGLPYAFASHFAPALLLQAIEVYRRNFRPSAELAQPYVMMGVPLVAAPTDEEAAFLATTIFQRVVAIATGAARIALPPPREGYLDQIGEREREAIRGFLGCAVIGGPAKVRADLQTLADQTGCDEMIFTCDIYDPALRLRALDIVAEAGRDLRKTSTP